MSFYRKYILPRATHLTCGMKPMMRQRKKVIPRASGHVLEVGFGSGLNLPFYDSRNVSKLWGLDPYSEMTKIAEDVVRDAPFEVEILKAPGEEMPLEDRSMDTIVMTYTLCTIADPQKTFAEMARVLKPEGSLLFCEHGVSPDPSVHSWQDRLTPIWMRLAGGCHLNRDIPKLITQGGFRIRELETGYVSGLRIASYNYLGIARFG
ncbi:Methyltransferase domain-containing protein [Desulfonatronum thiosulfatophilum]|uniref:Methyltransferase domain-containing protein n=1 Tax=Desulfonatronum thiosulfatophilum TaxID=617002 RepID=A0A1G6AA32_9BACT|nr:class I SAM-dependent methyltransferase [Desulfonatronum thiosulfatophilum]SDB05242.1 Methyltransferase domain-containing protein [Desulfonatronum thiosulfatophilum]